MIYPPLLGPDPNTPFPPAQSALAEPDGLVCVGGDLAPQRLVNAYASGLFPWFNEGQPILWWSPSKRMVFRSDGVHLSKRFRRQFRLSDWEIRYDTDFEAVLAQCAEIPRGGDHGTWITSAMRRAYCHLHELGYAHSVEVWSRQRLVGGLYGVSVGTAFHAESMFSAESGGSKLAMAALGQQLLHLGWPWFDAQVENDHLHRMGGELWPRDRFLAKFLPRAANRSPSPRWAAQQWSVPALLAAYPQQAESANGGPEPE